MAVVVDPGDYALLGQALDEGRGRLSWSQRQRLAAKAFAHTAGYDGAIANFLNALPNTPDDAGQPEASSQPAGTAEGVNADKADNADNTVQAPSPSESQALPRILSLQFKQQQAMRYALEDDINIAGQRFLQECLSVPEEATCDRNKKQEESEPSKRSDRNQTFIV